MFELANGVRSILEACKAVEQGESFLVLVDNEGESIWVGQIIMNVINSMGAEAVMTVINPTQGSAQEPPVSVAQAMKKVNAIIRVTDRGSMAHTNARKEATEAGARYYIILQIPVDDLKRGVSADDLRLIQKRTEKVAEMLTRATVAKITTPFGTKLTISLAGREGLALNPMSRIMAAFPYYAESAIAVLEGTAEGILVANLAISGWGYLFQEPLCCTVKAGKVVDISGNIQDAERLRKLVVTDENASNIAELGIGTSHIIPMPVNGTRRDFARMGTAHIGIGRSDDIGGKTWSRVHVDALMNQVTIELDDQRILHDGELLPI